MAATGTGPWIKFFKDAGLPSTVAATYALTFCENRIRMDMLLDLTKEILKDMGISLMGDVIAILRHARRVHEQTAREKVLAGSPARVSHPSSPVVHSSVRVTDQSSPSHSSDSGNSSPQITIGDTSPKQRITLVSFPAASRMVQHYTRQTDIIEKSPLKMIGKDVVPVVKQNKVIVGIKKRVKTKTVATQDNDDVSIIPLKKVRRVLPEHEGRYKITMPSGSTPRTQQILAKQGLLPAKKTVFERLGEGSVSSTTGMDGPLITITGLGTKIVKNFTDKQTSSVFSRLGDKQQVTSSTPPDLDEEEDNDETTEYAGILKQPVKKSILVKKVPISHKAHEATMRADAESSTVIKKKVLLSSRLGSSTGVRVSKPGIVMNSLVRPMRILKKLKNKTTAGILANPTNATKLSVKARLGASSSGSKRMLTTVPKKEKPQPITFNTPSSTVTSHPPVKSVTFGTVTQKVYMKEPTVSNLHPRITMSKRSSVFGRLGT